MIVRRLWWLGVGFLILPGCMVDLKDFDALREQVKLEQKQINDLKARQEDVALRIDTLNNGFKILGDKAEESARRIDDLEEKKEALGGMRAPAMAAAPPAAPMPEPPPRSAPPAPPVPPPAPAPTAAPPPPAAPPAQDTILLTNRTPGGPAAPPASEELITAGPKAEKLYATALDLFSKHKYDEATLKFEDFVVTYPDHKLAGNAQYWIGECYYSQNRFKEAADEFSKVEKIYTTSPKVPAALYKRGLSLLASKKIEEAKSAFRQLQARFPKSDEAAKAGEKLASLEPSGQQPASAGAR